jgi:ribonuclease P protein component
MAVLPGPEGPRLGVTVSKKVAPAVQRNRIRRVAREVFRRNRNLFPDSGDVVMIARSGAATLDYRAVRDEVEGASTALRRAALTRPEPGRGPTPPDPVSPR